MSCGVVNFRFYDQKLYFMSPIMHFLEIKYAIVKLVIKIPRFTCPNCIYSLLQLDMFIIMSFECPTVEASVGPLFLSGVRIQHSVRFCYF